MFNAQTLNAQFSKVADKVAANLSRSAGVKMAFTPKHTLLLGKGDDCRGLSFQFNARKRAGEFFNDCARVEVTYDAAADLYDAEINLMTRGNLTTHKVEGLDAEQLQNLGTL